MQFLQRFSIVISILVFPAILSAQGLDTAKIDQTLGRSGQKMGDIYRVAFPRMDLHVISHGVAIKPGFALGSWAAFSGTDNEAHVMGDLALLQDELNPVIEKLRSSGFEITAIHNHLLDESPRVMYVHYMGHGPATQIAGSLRAALAVSKTPLEKPAPAVNPPTPPTWTKTVEEAIGRKGTFNGGVLAFGVPRTDAITMDGMPLAPSQGVAESISFQEATPGKVATTGDFVLTATEVNPVISALQENHIAVTGLHSHMLIEQPKLFFMHFWAVGTPESVGKGIKAALRLVSTKNN